MVAILGYSRDQIVSAVQDMYTAVARNPEAHFHFPVGESACRALGYKEEEISRVPASVRSAFAGVGCPQRCAMVRPGDRVPDVGAGAGMDAILASQKAGQEGQVIALDITPAMTHTLRANLDQADIRNVFVIQGSAEQIPLASASIDCVTSNGALNLVPDKPRAIKELFRVLKPGGRLQLADVVIRRPVTVDCHDDPRLWVECVVGATVDDYLLELFRASGFEDVELARSHDYFAHSPSTQTRAVAESFGARSIELRMRRSERPPHPLKKAWKLWGPHRLIMDLWRRGLAGTFSLVAALLACYGTLAAIALLTLLGMSASLNPSAWSASIMLFTMLTVLAVAAGAWRHHNPTPLIIAGSGAGIIAYALLVSYSMTVELAGFVLIGSAVALDLNLRRQTQKRVLGLDRH